MPGPSDRDCSPTTNLVSLGQEMRKPSRHPGSVFGPSAADSVTVSRRRAGSAAHGCSSKEVRLSAATPGTPESLVT